ncbi:hypothetical protein [Exiguobacterium sp. S22-S28]|uniref:hypothetical protein n=1 Tax=Exiguobacterium sp. S22-S28 TaxID=3342768 RepID=UPI00372D5C86
MNQTITGKSIIKNASKIGEHALEFRNDSLVMADMGGLFVEASVTQLFYKKELHQISVSRLVLEDRLDATGWTDERKELFSFSCDIASMFSLLSACDYYYDFITFSDVRGKGTDGAYTIMKFGKDVSFKELSYDNSAIYFTSESGEQHEINLSDVKEIRDNGNCISYIKTLNMTYELICSLQVRQLLNDVREVIERLNKLGKMSGQIVLKGKVNDFIAYKENGCLKVYEVKNLELKYVFSLEKLRMYIGSRHLVLMHESDIICAGNRHARLICIETGIIPTKLYELSGANLITNKKQAKYKELLLWREDTRWYLFNPTKEKLVKKIDGEVYGGKENNKVIVLRDGLLSSSLAIDFLESIETAKILMTTTGFPIFFERLKISTIRISIPGKVLWEQSVKNFYDAETHQIDGDMRVDLNTISMSIPIDMYKSHYTQSLMESKTPSLPNVPITMLLTSRARNLSDMLIYEFFGQWQILMDYMSSYVDGGDFSEDEIRNHGLFMYHAIYQQRKRMEEISSKFPHFMSTLATEVGVGRSGDQIHQRQQRQMFQLSAQLKSQFTEIENLLSQVTYVHFHNDEYQRRIDQAYKESSLKKTGGAIAVGIGVGVLTGGIGLILPAMTVISEWATSKQRKELSDLQAEKEFKKNEFLFKKAVDLVRHIDAFTINHHVDVLNQFTFETLQLEAQEIMGLDPDHGRRLKLLKQSVHLYAKNTLPVAFDQGLVPQRVVTSILEKPSKKDEGIASLFLD